MEVTPAFLEHTDYYVGWLVDVLADRDILDDTFVYYIIGDNGASARAPSTARSTTHSASTAQARWRLVSRPRKAS